MKVVQFGDGYWVAYFEGTVKGSCTWTTCDSTEALVKEIQEHLEQGLSIQSVCYGEGMWFVYFDGELKGRSVGWLVVVGWLCLFGWLDG